MVPMLGRLGLFQAVGLGLVASAHCRVEPGRRGSLSPLGDRGSRVLVLPVGSIQIRMAHTAGRGRRVAGGYALQGLGGIFVTRIAGSCSGVVGLPVAETYTLLRDFAIPCGPGRT